LDDPLRLTPRFPDTKPLPDLAIAAFDEIEAVGNVRTLRDAIDLHIDGKITPDADTMVLDEAIDGLFDLKQLRACAVSDRQMEKHVAMHDLGLATRSPLTRPNAGKGETPAKKPLVKPLSNFGKESAIRIIADVRAEPVDGQMRHQGEADYFGVIHRRFDISGLVEGDVFGASRTIWLPFSGLHWGSA
jgi:hypothetical protein